MAFWYHYVFGRAWKVPRSGHTNRVETGELVQYYYQPGLSANYGGSFASDMFSFLVLVMAAPYLLLCFEIINMYSWEVIQPFGSVFNMCAVAVHL